MISVNSRYIDTKLIKFSGDYTYWGLWKRVSELRDSEKSFKFKEHRVKSYEVGCLDILAERYFNNERLWWIIAAFNNFIDPVQDMIQGQIIKIPSVQFVMLFLGRT